MRLRHAVTAVGKGLQHALGVLFPLGVGFERARADEMLCWGILLYYNCKDYKQIVACLYCQPRNCA